MAGLADVAWQAASRFIGFGGAAVSSQVADGTAVGGNPRGTNATDLQTGRALATQVASGPGSFLGSGANNTSSGQQSVVTGGASNNANATQATIAGGSSNTISSNGVRAFIGGGQSNVANALRAVVAGGNSNTADADHCWIPGGANATTRGHLSRGAWAAGNFAALGDAQAGEYVVRRISTDATAGRLTADNNAASSSNTLNLPNNGTYMMRLLVVAQQTGGSAGMAGDAAGWELTALIVRGANAAATVLTGSSGSSVAPLYNAAAAAAWRVGLTADTINGGLAVTATGETNKTIRWVARVISVEVTA